MLSVGLLGGSFNPFHVGHLRLAIEVLERLGLARVDLTPCSVPPHKDAGDLLSFELRSQCIARSIGAEAGALPIGGLELNSLECERSGPSYTWDTLQAYSEREPEAKVHFVLGAGDLLTLPSWKRGLELPEQATLVVVPRQQRDLQDVASFMVEHWPDAEQAPLPQNVAAAWSFPGGAKLLYLPLPRVDVSGEMIREIWRSGRSLRGLVTDAALALLEREVETVAQFWGVRGSAPSTPSW